MCNGSTFTLSLKEVNSSSLKKNILMTVNVPVTTQKSTDHVSFIRGAPVVLVIGITEAKVVTACEAFCPLLVFNTNAQVFCQLQLLNSLKQKK